MDELRKRNTKRLSRLRQDMPYTDVRPARTGKRDADGTINSDPTTGLSPGYIWVREGEDGERGQTHALIVRVRDDVPDLPIQIGYHGQTGELCAIEPRIDSRSLSTYGASLAGLGVARQSVSTNTQLTDSSNITEGRVRPADIGGLNVTIEGFHYGSKYKPDTTISVSANVPGTTGQTRWVLVYYNPLADTFTAVSGTADTRPISAFQEMELTNISVPLGCIVNGAFLVSNGDTAITASNFRNGVDARDWLNERRPLNKYDGTTAPVVGDDSEDGYSVGSLWLDTVGDHVYMATDVSAGAANWEQLDGGGSGGSATYPKRATMWHYDSLVLAGNALTRQIDTAAWYAVRAYQNTPAINDEFTNGFLVAAGTYTLAVYGVDGTNRGIITWYVDGVSQGTQDWYGAGAAAVQKTMSITVATDGWHVLKGKVTSKHASSSDYYAILTQMVVIPSAD